MSPIINSFLRPMGQPTWYNQDGAIRTIIGAKFSLSAKRSRVSPSGLHLLLAHDAVRLHLARSLRLRVATLVNLSFLGMDKLNSVCLISLARRNRRCIPEGVKRFTIDAAAHSILHPAGTIGTTPGARPKRSRKSRPSGGLFTTIVEMRLSGVVSFVIAAAMATATLQLVRTLRRDMDREPFADGRGQH
jgi:cyclic beta-1,2-glucan synthetase